MIITSKSNPIIAETKKLKQSKHRKKYGLFIAEGERNVSDSLKRGEAVRLFITEGTETFLKVSCPVYTVTESVMKEICDTVTPQGIVCVFKIPAFREDQNSDKILALNGVSDPGNVGTVLRTALAMGYFTVICDEKTADVYSPKVVRSAMSAVFSLNIMKTDSLAAKLAELKNKGYLIYSGYLGENSKEICNICFPERNIIVLGNEGNGVDKEILDITDTQYIIPMPGGTESLNAAVAAGITMYAAQNQK